jgi:hypothetical protein
VAFDESLTKALRTKTDGKADIVIGKSPWSKRLAGCA